MKKYLNPHCFMLNSLAMGDVIAAAPVVKHMVENYYTDPGSYMVVAKQAFRPILHFIPDSNFHDFDKKENTWGIPADFAISILNTKKDYLTRNTPKHMTLGQFASLKLADRMLSPKDYHYVPLKKVDVSHLGVNFKETVILVTSYRDATRAWHADSVLAVAKYIRGKGLTPVFIGKTDMDIATHLIPKTSLPESAGVFGIDLRNKTSVPELATLMGQAVAVCGIDSGPIHIAGTTSVPIVCGYTSVSPEHRIPSRPRGKTYPVVPKTPCIGCESKLESHFWNFEDCYLGHINCCKDMTPNLFIDELEKILG